MLIDNEKFIGLLVENSGIEREKVEKYLEELITDVKTAFDEGEGYEVDGFGIFSKLGANVLFIPSDELETEVNYKYVGMEPIELPNSAANKAEEEEDKEQEENPIQGILDGEDTEESNEYDDPFAELLGEEELEDETVSQSEDSVDEEEIEAAVEEEIENEEQEEIFEEIAEEQNATNEELSKAENVIEESAKIDEEGVEDPSEDIFSEDEDTEFDNEEEEVPGPEKWGIDAHKEDDQEDAFSGLLGDASKEDLELIDEEDIFASEDGSQEEQETEEEIDFSALEEDFDDPFKELDEDSNDDKEDFIPVVTNVSSEKTTDNQEVTNEDTLENSEKDRSEKNKKVKSSSERNKNPPVFLYLVLGLIILAGTGYMLAYYGIVNIKGITPSNKNQVAQISTPTINTPQNTESTKPIIPEENEAENVSPTNNADEEATPNADEELGDESELENQTQESEIGLDSNKAEESFPNNDGIITPINIQAGAEPYGLNGTATEAGNNGYTIVLYTLSKKAGADAQFEKLSKDGYRVIIKQRPSDTYGVLYRVSIGQFKSLANAAVAAEKVDQDILGNYIITKI